jgi:hypothetical protein
MIETGNLILPRRAFLIGFGASLLIPVIPKAIIVPVQKIITPAICITNNLKIMPLVLLYPDGRRMLELAPGCSIDFSYPSEVLLFAAKLSGCMEYIL